MEYYGVMSNVIILNLPSQTIDETTKAKAAVEIRVAGLEQDLADYKRKYEEEVAAHTFTKESIPKVRQDNNYFIDASTCLFIIRAVT